MNHRIFMTDIKNPSYSSKLDKKSVSLSIPTHDLNIAFDNYMYTFYFCRKKKEKMIFKMRQSYEKKYKEFN